MWCIREKNIFNKYKDCKALLCATSVISSQVSVPFTLLVLLARVPILTIVWSIFEMLNNVYALCVWWVLMEERKASAASKNFRCLLLVARHIVTPNLCVYRLMYWLDATKFLSCKLF